MVKNNTTVCAQMICAVQVLIDKGVITPTEIEEVRTKHGANDSEEPRKPETGSEDSESDSEDADEPGLVSESDSR